MARYPLRGSFADAAAAAGAAPPGAAPEPASGGAGAGPMAPAAALLDPEQGFQHGTRWAPDDLFGTALACDAAGNSTVMLRPPRFGESGSLAVNLWMRQGVTDGQGFEYILSLADEVNATAAGPEEYYAWAGNNLHVFVPEVAHPAHGVVRFIYKDRDDGCDYSELCQTWLDSDGGYMNNYARDVPGHVDLEDNQWHMLTLSTMPGTPNGFAVYVDGVLAGVAPPKLVEVGMQVVNENAVPGGGDAFNSDGGHPFTADGPLYLCSRADLHADRYFTGKLAEVELFDTALTPDQVFQKYVAVVGAEQGMRRALGLYMGHAAAASDGALLADIGGGTSKAGESCITNGVMRCEEGLMCIPNADSILLLEGMEGMNGLCVALPMGGLGDMAMVQGLLPAAPLGTVPTPLAFFPLTGDNADSWPYPVYQGRLTEGARFGSRREADPLFGDTLHCNGRKDSEVAIDPVPYAARGPFAVNLWLRKNSNVGGGEKADEEVFYFHSNAAGEENISLELNAQDQLHLHVQDADDAAFGHYTIDDSYFAAGAPDLADGQWHMVTLTSAASGAPGVEVYLDGMPARPAGEAFAMRAGGAPMDLSREIYLCGRHDSSLRAERDMTSYHYTGSLAHLMLFDQPLNAGQVAELYMAVVGPERLEQQLAGGEAPAEAAEEATVVACPADVQPCPDGSFVGRLGPACEFPACPDEVADGGGDVEVAETRAEEVGAPAPERGGGSAGGAPQLSQAALIGIGAAFGILVVLLVIAVVFLVVRQRKKRGSIEMAGMPGGMPAARTVSNKSTNYEQFDDAEVTSAGGVTLKSSGAIVEP